MKPRDQFHVVTQEQGLNLTLTTSQMFANLALVGKPDSFNWLLRVNLVGRHFGKYRPAAVDGLRARF